MTVDELRAAAERIGKVLREDCRRCHGNGGYDHYPDPHEGYSCWMTCWECVEVSDFLQMGAIELPPIDGNGSPV